MLFFFRRQLIGPVEQIDTGDGGYFETKPEFWPRKKIDALSHRANLNQNYHLIYLNSNRWRNWYEFYSCCVPYCAYYTRRRYKEINHVSTQANKTELAALNLFFSKFRFFFTFIGDLNM